MREYASKIKEKMLEFTRLFSIETSIFQRFVIVYKYIYFLNSDPIAKGIMQKLFDETAKAIGKENNDKQMDEDEFINIKGKALFSREFWIYYTNLEVIHKRMKKMKDVNIPDDKEFNNLYKLFSKPYSKQMLELSFTVVNSEVFERLDKDCFFKQEKKEKLFFDDKRSILYLKGLRIRISKQDKRTNAHKILHHIFITNRKNIKDDFFYSEIAEDEFGELDYKSRKNNWKKYHNTCFELNKKIEKATKLKNFLKYNTGKKGKVKINCKYL